jgi:hypothetical protein
MKHLISRVTSIGCSATQGQRTGGGQGEKVATVSFHGAVSFD